MIEQTALREALTVPFPRWERAELNRAASQLSPTRSKGSRITAIPPSGPLSPSAHRRGSLLPSSTEALTMASKPTSSSVVTPLKLQRERNQAISGRDREREGRLHLERKLAALARWSKPRKTTDAKPKPAGERSASSPDPGPRPRYEPKPKAGNVLTP